MPSVLDKPPRDLKAVADMYRRSAAYHAREIERLEKMLAAARAALLRAEHALDTIQNEITLRLRSGK